MRKDGLQPGCQFLDMIGHEAFDIGVSRASLGMRFGSKAKGVSVHVQFAEEIGNSKHRVFSFLNFPLKG